MPLQPLEHRRMRQYVAGAGMGCSPANSSSRVVIASGRPVATKTISASAIRVATLDASRCGASAAGARPISVMPTTLGGGAMRKGMAAGPA